MWNLDRMTVEQALELYPEVESWWTGDRWTGHIPRPLPKLHALAKNHLDALDISQDVAAILARAYYELMKPGKRKIRRLVRPPRTRRGVLVEAGKSEPGSGLAG